MYSFKEFCVLTEEFEQVSHRLGSNPGGIFMDKDSGQKAYIKFPPNPEQAKVEVATSKMYDKIGVKTFHPEIYKLGDKIGVKTKWRDGMKIMGDPQHREFTEDHAKHLATMLHAATITKNWDVVGLDFSNIVHDGKNFYSIDQGGSMHYRAQGEHKGFDSHIDSDEFKDPSHTGGMLRRSIESVYPRVMRDTIENVKKLKDSDIDQISDEVGLDRKYGDVVKARRDMLLQHYGVK